MVTKRLLVSETEVESTRLEKAPDSSSLRTSLVLNRFLSSFLDLTLKFDSRVSETGAPASSLRLETPPRNTCN